MYEQEKRQAKLIYRLPLMLALTGLALLLLQWTLSFSSMEAFQDFVMLLRHNWYILILPAALLLLYLFRAPAKIAFIAAGTSAVLLCIQLFAAFLRSYQDSALAVWFPGNTLLISLRTALQQPTFTSVLQLCTDLVLLSVCASSVFVCMRYASIRQKTALRAAHRQHPTIPKEEENTPTSVQSGDALESTRVSVK